MQGQLVSARVYERQGSVGAQEGHALVGARHGRVKARQRRIEVELAPAPRAERFGETHELAAEPCDLAWPAKVRQVEHP